MEEFLLKKDYNRMGKIAHKMCTSVAMMGIEELVETISSIEEKCKTFMDTE
jgi:hypothetical protein